jgi:hypothetical protein
MEQNVQENTESKGEERRKTEKVFNRNIIICNFSPGVVRGDEVKEDKICE